MIFSILALILKVCGGGLVEDGGVALFGNCIQFQVDDAKNVVG